MKRPELIPPDVWGKLTCNDAANAGLLGSVPKEWLIVGGKALLRDADDTALVASMLRENISEESAQRACSVVRTRKMYSYDDQTVQTINRRLASWGISKRLTDEPARGPLEYSQSVASAFEAAALFGGANEDADGSRTSMMQRPKRIPEDVWNGLTVREAVDADLLGHAALEMTNPDGLCSALKHDDVVAKCLRQNVENAHPNLDDIVAKRCNQIRKSRSGDELLMHARLIASVFGGADDEAKRDKFAREVRQLERDEAQSNRMKRPTHIPEDVWDKLTIGIAAEAGLLPLVCGRTEADVLCKNIEAHLLRTHASELAGTAQEAVERARDMLSRLHVHACPNCYEKKCCYMACTIEPDLGTTNDGLPSGSHCRCFECGPEPEEPEPPPPPVFVFREDICPSDSPLLPPYQTRVQVPGGGTVTIRMDRVCVVDQRQNTTCFVQGDKTIRFWLPIDEPHTAIAERGVHAGNTRREMARSVLVFDRAVRLGEEDAVAAYGLILFALAAQREQNKYEPIREDICRNDKPLLPPFETVDTTDRVMVTMLYPYAGTETIDVRCSLMLRAFGESTIEYGRRIGCHPSESRQVSAQHASTPARARIAEDVLAFDLSVRTGKPLAVSTYGMILFALEVRRETERRVAERLFANADAAIDAVLSTAREQAESEGR